MSAKPLHLRLFLEGIELPVIAANVSANTNAPASASIQILPLDSAMDLKPRTMVHLFYLDVDGVYRLLFTGEVHGFAFQQTPMSRALTLQCLDFSSYWDAAHATAVEFGPQGNAFTHRGSLYAGDTSTFDDIVNHQAEVLLNWIRSKPQTPGLKNVSGLAGGIISMMEAMGGVLNHRKGINDFFSVSELRCKLLQQINAEENDSTAANLMAGEVLMEWLKSGIQNAGQQVTFRDMLLMLMQYIYYESVPNPTPHWTPSVEGSKGTDPVAQRLKTQFIRPDCWFAVPPACNIIFPEHFTQLTFDRAWTQEVTRVLVSAYISLIQGNDPTTNQLLDSRIFAPNIAEVTTQVTKDPNYSPDSNYRNLLDHELHTGIIPREERIPDTHNVTGGGGPSVSWAKRAALFHFFKYRFAPRQANISGRFNPNVVCGFPAVIVRGPYIPDPEELKGLSGEQVVDFIHKNAKRLKAPYHFVGMVAGVVHQINQDGGSTSISMHSVRRHAGTDDEYMNILRGAETTEKQIVRVVVTSDQAKMNDSVLQILRGITPQGAAAAPKASGKWVEESVEVVTPAASIDPRTDGAGMSNGEFLDAMLAKNNDTLTDGAGMSNAEYLDHLVGSKKVVTRRKWVDNTAPKTPPFTSYGDIPAAKRTHVLVPQGKTDISVGSKKGFFTNSSIVGIEVDAAKGETNVIETVDRDGTSINLFKKVIVYQQVELPIPSNMSMEETLRPTWMSPAYSPSNIGKKIYQPFFGCDSVIDRASFVTDSMSVSLREGKATEPPTVTAVDKDGKAVGDFYVDELKAVVANDRDMSLEKALNVLAFVYGQARQNGKDTDDFIRQVINRPVANMEQILGEFGIDLEVAADGSVTVLPTIQDGNKKRPGKLGFHTLSVHEKVINSGVRLAGLLQNPDIPLPRSSGHGKKTTIPGKYDVRKEKWDRVKDYADTLVGSSGRQAIRG